MFLASTVEAVSIDLSHRSPNCHRPDKHLMRHPPVRTLAREIIARQHRFLLGTSMTSLNEGTSRILLHVEA